MFFTREDILKIQAELTKLGVKDSDFRDAHTPLDHNDMLVLTQGGRNVKIRIQDFLEQLHLLSSDDFINVTTKFDAPHLSLEEAIIIIPHRSRKIGLTITFQNIEGNWEMWQFTSNNIHQFNEPSVWENCKVSVDGIAVPDEEDLTMVTQGTKQVAKFKDKVYDPNNFSGKGRVYLRKNVAKVQDPNTKETKTINFLTQKMLGKENTVYVIQYDYDLNGQTVTVPSGCTLDFQGGSINNGEMSFSKGCIINGNFISSKLTIYGDYSFYNRNQIDSSMSRGTIQELGKIFNSYYKHTDTFVYGGKNAAFYPGFDINKQHTINCSTFSLLMACGIPYENSKYGGGDNTSNGIGGWNYKELIEWVSDQNPNRTGDEALRFSHHLARYLTDKGFTIGVPPLESLQAGDILFFDNTSETTGVHPYIGIDHSATFAYMVNDNKYAVWEVQNAGPVLAYYTRKSYQKAVLVARLPKVLRGMDSLTNVAYNPFVEHNNIPESLVASVYPIGGTIKAYKYYTLVVKCDFSDGTKAYPRVVRGDTVLCTYSDFNERPEDGYYLLPFISTEDIGSVNLQIVTRITGDTVSVSEIYLFDGLISFNDPLFTKPILYKNNVALSSMIEDENILTHYRAVNFVPNGINIKGSLHLSNEIGKESAITLFKLNVGVQSGFRVYGLTSNGNDISGVIYMNSSGEVKFKNPDGTLYHWYDITIPFGQD